LQDRNEAEDLRITRHRDRRDQIMADLLTDPEVRRLHEAAHARAEARLAEYRPSEAYQSLVQSLISASEVPIGQVVAKPPKARDRAAIAAMDQELVKRRSENAGKDHPVSVQPVGALLPASPYVSGPVGVSDSLHVEVIENYGLKIPLDPGIFTPSALEILRVGKFDRRNVRNLGGLLHDCTRLLDLDCGIGFLCLKARLANPAMQVTLHDERPSLHVFSQKLVALNFPDSTGIRRSQTTLNADAGWGGLAGLIAACSPDVLRLSEPNLSVDAFPPASLTGIRRILIPIATLTEATLARERLGPAFIAAGFAEDPAGEAVGTLLFRRD
jgi:hypothetical protein